MITWRMKLPPKHDAFSTLLFDKWHEIFYMPSRTHTAGYTKAIPRQYQGNSLTPGILVKIASTMGHSGTLKLNSI